MGEFLSLASEPNIAGGMLGAAKREREYVQRMVFLALWEGKVRLTRRMVGRTAKRQNGRPRIEVVIARRVLASEPPSQRKYEVRIGKPEPDGAGDWRCAYHVRGIGMRSPRYAFGVDSVQALILALNAVRSDLEAAGDACHWVGGERGDSGFPRYVPAAFGLRFSRRINCMIDREVTRHCKKLEVNARQRKRSRKT